MGKFELQGLGFEFFIQHPEQISRVKKEDVIRVANKYLNNEKALIVEVY